MTILSSLDWIIYKQLDSFITYLYSIAWRNHGNGETLISLFCRYINLKVDLDDKKMKIVWFNVKKIVLSIVRGYQSLYISLKFNYKFNSWLLQCFSLIFSILSPWKVFYII